MVEQECSTISVTTKIEKHLECVFLHVKTLIFGFVFSADPTQQLNFTSKIISAQDYKNLSNRNNIKTSNFDY